MQTRIISKEIRGYPRITIRGNPRRGISTVEYSVWMAVVVATLIGMSVYAMRALSGRWRAVGDSFGTGRQYEPNVTKVF